MLCLQRLKKPFGEQIRYLTSSWQRMLRNNDFYLNDIVNMVTAYRDLVQRQLSRAISS